MSTLYLRLPARIAVAEASRAAQSPAQLGCRFALTTDAGQIEREGAAPLPELGPLIARAQRVVLILAATDVSLLRVALPPLSPARLKAALPNLVEDQLLTDPAEAVVVAGRSADGLRTVAVVQRDWLEMLAKMLLALGARNMVALPAQLCLPHQTDAVNAAVSVIETGFERDTTLVVRLAAEEGIGLPLVAASVGADPAEVAPAALQLLQLVAPAAAITLSVAAAEMAAYQAAAQAAAAGESRITITEEDWAHWIAGAAQAQPDLFSGLGSAAGRDLDWSRWRWPLILAGAVLLVNVFALNLDWWRLRQEAKATRAAQTRIFQEAYPAETVIVDPMLQMQQKMAAAKRAAGQPAPDDFAPLVAGFADAWSRAAGGGQALPAIAALEYHERVLLVRVKAPGEIPLAQLQPMLAAHNLALTPEGADALQIRSAR